MNIVLHIIDSISYWTGKIFGFVWLVVIFIISWEVVSRYAFDRPMTWAHESMVYLSGIVYIMGGAYVLYLGGHVNVDILYSRFSPRIKAFADLFTFPFFFVFCGVLLWNGAPYAWDSWTVKETSGGLSSMPVYPAKIALAVGAFLILLQGLAKFTRDLATVFSRRTSHEY